MSFATLECDRLTVSLSLTAAHERASLERDLRDALGSRLAAALARFAAGRDDGARLFIDRLEVEAGISGTADLDMVVHGLARRIAAAVGDEIAQGTGLRFRDRSDYLASFVLALADGSAWTRWQFGEFDGLRMLSTSNALRSALLMEDAALESLGRLTESGARQVVDALNGIDAARVVASFRARESARRGPWPLLWRQSRELMAGIDSAPKAWLTALVASERALAGSGSEATVGVLQRMCWLRDIAESRALEGIEPDIQDARAFFAGLASKFGMPLDWCDAATDTDLRAMLCELRQAPGKAGRGARLWSPWGGALLLLGRLANLGWLERWRSTLDSDGVRLLAFAIVAQALSPRDATRLVLDSALLLAFGVADVRKDLRARRRSLEDALAGFAAAPERAGRVRARGMLVGWVLGRRVAQAASQLLEAFAGTLPGTSGSSHDYLRANLLSLPVAVEAVDGGVRATLGRAPLDVLLVLAGCKRGSWYLPGHRRIECLPEPT